MRPGANWNGAYTSKNVGSQAECISWCMSMFPTCAAVDYNIGDRVCFAFHMEHRPKFQPNKCCNRFEIYCNGT